MSTEDETLFGHALKCDIHAAVNTYERKERVVIDHFITLCGKRFDLVDIKETLEEVKNGTVAVDHRLGDVLVKLRVLTTRGNRNSHPAKEGENFEFMEKVVESLLSRERKMNTYKSK